MGSFDQAFALRGRKVMAGIGARCSLLLPLGLGLLMALPAKDLSLTLRWATHLEGDGYTAPGNTRGNTSADEYRLIVDYPVSLF